MRKVFLSGTLLLTIMIFTGCTPKYLIINETAFNHSARQYKNIYVGWLDIDETKWRDYRYKSIENWKACIHEMNVLGLQKYLKDRLPGKDITGDMNKSNNFPVNGGLYIKNTITQMEETKGWHGIFAGGFVKELRALTVKIQFYDIETKKEIYTTTVKATSSGAQWRSIESMLDAIVYNLADYTSRKLL